MNKGGRPRMTGEVRYRHRRDQRVQAMITQQIKDRIQAHLRDGMTESEFLFDLIRRELGESSAATG